MALFKPDPPPPPNYAPVAQASRESAKYSFEMGQKNLEWAREQFNTNRADAERVIDAALIRQGEQDKVALQDRARYEDTFQPLEDNLRDEALRVSNKPARDPNALVQARDARLAQEDRDLSSGIDAARTRAERFQKERELEGREEAEQLAGGAAASTSQEFERARLAAQERLEGFGIDPSQVRAGALDMGIRTAEAAARATAANTTRYAATERSRAVAREDAQRRYGEDFNVLVQRYGEDRALAIVDQQTARQDDLRDEAAGRALRTEAINVGRGYPGQIAQAYGTALQSGNQAINTGLQTTASGASTMGTGLQWQGAGNQGLGQWGSALNTGYQNQLGAYKAENDASSGIGSLIGMGAGMYLGGPSGAAAGKKLFNFEEGGAVPAITLDTDEYQEVGADVDPTMSASRGAIVDDIPARLNAGEFVVPTDAVQWLGEKHFQTLIQKAREEKAKAPAKPQIRAALPVG